MTDASRAKRPPVGGAHARAPQRGHQSSSSPSPDLLSRKFWGQDSAAAHAFTSTSDKRVPSREVPTTRHQHPEPLQGLIHFAKDAFLQKKPAPSGMSTRLLSRQGEDLVCKQRTRGLGTGGLCRGTFETDEEVSSGPSLGRGGTGLQTSASISPRRSPRQHPALPPPPNPPVSPQGAYLVELCVSMLLIVSLHQGKTSRAAGTPCLVAVHGTSAQSGAGAHWGCRCLLSE